MMLKTEKIVQNKTCAHCGAPFNVTDKDLEFYDKVSPVFAGKKYAIPTPTFCPECRKMRRLAFRNVGKIYKRKCDLTGKEVVSIYSPDKPFTAYNQDDWWTDKWDAMDYGKNFDFSRTFFEQFRELQLQVPRIALLNGFNENTEYANHAWYQKNCYLSMNAANNEDCFYTDGIYYSHDTMDATLVHNCEFCYEITDSSGCYGVKFGQNCNKCSNSWFLYECENCRFCFGCANLVNQQYVVYNRQVSKDEYDRFIQEFLSSPEKFLRYKNDFEAIKFSATRKCATVTNCENCTGNYLKDSKRCKEVYNGYDLENVAYCTELHDSKDCMDTDIYGEGMSLTCECHGVGGKSAYQIFFSNIIWGETGDIWYSDHCLGGCFHIFGCV